MYMSGDLVGIEPLHHMSSPVYFDYHLTTARDCQDNTWDSIVTVPAFSLQDLSGEANETVVSGLSNRHDRSSPHPAQWRNDRGSIEWGTVADDDGCVEQA